MGCHTNLVGMTALNKVFCFVLYISGIDSEHGNSSSMHDISV